ncbi:uncharacterized protein RCC_04356 [Ramularia collo-cygni]|uniref:mRNA-capping enzyme subunit beta n=1 Tax=Ramularia collo-cygni TaxID=112498 RepID=A0A2D3URC6_9PEZI|nr:uncharacterized protein RCC_04356 [Ramularia collo-cygni]CZT18511.1 uncharacterized protein RCC_04356 [Ramularia collo-cygni]
MDLSSMLNDGPAEERRSAAPQASPPARGHTIDHAPSTSASQARNRGLTPLQTPSQTPGGSQYPFPGPPQAQQQLHQHPAQSPISGPSYRPYDAYTATTPGARPTSQNYHFAQPSPSQYQQPGLHAQHTMSMSPTPPSHHSHTPHSVRQSPMATAMGQPPPQQQQAYPSSFHRSQPSTPLGPPPPLTGRHSNQLDMSSPYHQRTYSGASNGMVTGSPAQHNLSIGSLVESPSANYHRPSSARRSTSDYMSSAERERSLSVSPKTKVPARQPSSGSRHSSQQESYSARSSMQPSASVASQMGTPVRVPAVAPNYAQPPVNSGVEDSLSARNGVPNNYNHSQPPPLQHQPQKMDMHHLLSPTEHEPSPRTMHQNLPPSQHQQPPPPPPQNHTSSVPASTNQKPQQLADSLPNAPMKRPAVSPPAAEPPSKRGRRKYLERPIWAHLHPSNPRAKEFDAVPNSAQQAVPANATRTPQPQSQPQSQMHLQPQPQQNGPQPAHLNGNVHGPLDNDLILARRVLDPNWERSMDGKVPITSLVKQVMDWLYVNLSENADIGLDPREGAIEIEAKIGTLIDKQTGDRMALPVTSATVLDPRVNERFQFESQMLEAAHKKMNEFLNRLTKDAATIPGRKKIDYTHTRETDSFRTLNDAGLKLMPEALMKRNRRGDIKLRTSRRDKDGKVTGRIVKLSLAQLQIHSPFDSYDVRISMNLEVNLDQPDLDTLDITDNPTHDKPAQPDRRKDRVSYRHLACQTDLTRVDTPGLGPKYELELELDANVLRQQQKLLSSGQENGFQAVVEGFMDNLTLLMRQPKQ